MTFLEAYTQLMRRAPSPLFPRARQLYLRKYPLEPEQDSRFRTFVLKEQIEEFSDGSLRSDALAFAVVHWQACQVEHELYAAHLAARWRIHPNDLQPVESQPWFRDSGAWARFTSPAVYWRQASESVVS